MSGASAPGKMLVGGEYAVLDGAPAVVTAVQYRANVSWVTDDGPNVARPLSHAAPRFPEAAAARAEAEGELGPVDGELTVDVSALRSETQKLGVGSSAAAAAAAAAAVYAQRGLDPAGHRDEIFAAALAGHESVAPNGSGVDVAASVYGGLLRYVREPVSVEPMAWPEGLVFKVVWTGSAASTRDLIAQVHGLRDNKPDLYAECMRRLADRAQRLSSAFLASPAEVIVEIGAYGAAMDALGQASGAPIVEARLRRIAHLAARVGGAAKPSGAGGGDVALAVFSDWRDAEAFERDCALEGFDVLDVELGGPGVRAL